MTHDIKPEELANLSVCKENNGDILSFTDVMHNSYSYGEERWGLKNFATLDGDDCGGFSGIIGATQLLDSLEKAGYEVVKKHPNKVAVAVNEDWGVKHTRDGTSNWLKDAHGFPALFSEEKAKAMCISPEYTTHRLRLVAYELNFDSPA